MAIMNLQELGDELQASNLGSEFYLPLVAFRLKRIYLLIQSRPAKPGTHP